jgi:glycosyltransferase involved in cell wall biosynthesis
MLTIIHAEASDTWGGQDIRVLKEALWFQEQGHCVHLFNPAHGEIFKRASNSGLSCEPISFAKRAKLPDFIRLAKRFQALQPDVVCTHSSVDSWVGLLAARYCRVPVAIRYRHVSTPVKNNFMNRWQYGHLCNHVVTTAKVIQEDIQKTFCLPPNKVTTIPTGISLPVLPTREQAKIALRQRFNLPKDAQLIGQISVLRSWKGQYVLIDAFERLASLLPNTYLLLVGGGPVTGDYSKRSRESPMANRILLPGHQEDVWPFFRGLDVAVLSSTKNEGIPQSGLQAMFAGCPFVGTYVGGIPEIVEHEQTGLLVPPNNPQALGDALISILNQPELGQRMAESAQRMVRKRFTLQAMGQKLESLFQTLVAAAKSNTLS